MLLSFPMPEIMGNGASNEFKLSHLGRYHEGK